MIVQSQADLDALKKSGKIMASIRDQMVAKTVPGITTKELDDFAGKLFEEYGAVSAPKSIYDFPGFTCISVNEEVAHGIPGDRVIHEGDLVNIDVSGSKDGYFVDTGISFVVGGEAVNPKLAHLCEVAKLAFENGLKQCRAGKKQNGIGKVVYQTARQHGYTVIANLTGHGVGRSIHEEPDHILNYFDRNDTELLKDGMVIAFEPFISMGAVEAIQKPDGWTLTTKQKSFVAQYEHTIVITKDEPIVLTR